MESCLCEDAHSSVAKIMGDSGQKPRGGKQGFARGGWGQAGPHFSRSLRKEQGAQAEVSKAKAQVMAILASSLLPHLKQCPDLTQGQPHLLKGPKPLEGLVLLRGWRGGGDGPSRGPPNSVVCWTHTHSYKLAPSGEPHGYIVRNFASRH